MNLYLVDDRQFVIANGLAGAHYLALQGKDYVSMPIRLMIKDVENDFNPRCISTDEALAIYNRIER